MSGYSATREVSGITFTSFPLQLLVFTWSCGRCAAIVSDCDVHAGQHVGEDQVTQMVRNSADEVTEINRIISEG